MNPVFNNIHNPVYDTIDGPKYFSRSLAICAHIWFKKDDEFFVLLGLRGPKGDQPGKMNIPCGYMDWNENLKEATFREVWEETGIDLNQFDNILYSAVDQPWFLNTDPSQNRENITAHVGMLIDLNDNDFPTVTADNAEEGEVGGIFIMNVDMALNIKPEEWAFNHDKRLRNYLYILYNI